MTISPLNHLTLILRTGASGYIGGQVLHQLARAHPEYAVAALVRDAQVGKKISEKYPKVRIVNGSLDDVDLVESEAAQASVTLSMSFAGGKYSERKG